MELTCPHCRHTVDVGEAESGKCRNCGQIVKRPKPQPAAPQPAFAGTAPGGFVPTATPVARVAPPPPSSVDGAAMTAFVCGLLFFIPFITQLIAIICGLVAIGSPRRRERGMAFAVIGLLLGGFAVVGWVLLINRSMSAMTARTAGWTFPAPIADADYAAAERVRVLADEMELIQRAVVAFHRDFRRYPDKLAQIRGPYLADDFTPSNGLTIHFPGKRDTVTQDWPLVVSKEVKFDRDGAELNPPRRMMIRVSGRFEFHVPQDADAIIRQFVPPDQTTPEPGANVAETGVGAEPE